MGKRIGVGIVGAGFVAEFHVRSWQGVRGGDIVAVASTRQESAQRLSDLCRELDVGDATPYTDIKAMMSNPDVDAVWVTVPNHVRVPVVQEIVDAVKSGQSKVKAIAIEKPLARIVSEAKQILEMVEGAGLLHGYLENQLFAPSVVRGKDIIWTRGAALAGPPYLSRAAEEHNGPHKAWFWQGSKQGGGVLNDMMCHSVEAGRYLLTPPDKPDYLRPVAVSASTAVLKWGLAKYAEQLRQEYGHEVDYTRTPAEDYATTEVVYETDDGRLVISQANTSWSFVGPGLRLTFELLGPEYSLMINTLEPESKVFFSREVTGPEGEDLVEKQAAEQGQMPYLSDEGAAYGYEGENRHMTDAFGRGEMPSETLHDGLLVSKLLMAAYKSAELGAVVKFPPNDVDEFEPLVSKDKWDPRMLVERAR